MHLFKSCRNRTRVGGTSKLASQPEAQVSRVPTPLRRTCPVTELSVLRKEGLHQQPLRCQPLSVPGKEGSLVSPEKPRQVRSTPLVCWPPEQNLSREQ